MMVPRARVSPSGFVYVTWDQIVPRLPEEYGHILVYFFASQVEAESGDGDGATGFVFSESLAENDLIHCCIVTAYHVVSPYRERSSTMYARMYDDFNKVRIVPIPSEAWMRHPDGDDVAVYSLGVYHVSHHALPRSTTFWGFAERGQDGDAILWGDDVVMIGRLPKYEGRGENVAVARFGSIAIPKDTRVHNPFTGLFQESIIIELKSIIGASGAPVFSYRPITWDQSRNEPLGYGNLPPYATDPQSPGATLLGVMWGHLETEVRAKAVVTGLDADDPGRNLDLTIKHNSHMAAVVPAWKIKDILDGSEMQEKIRIAVAAYQKKFWESDGAMPDGHDR